MGCGDALPYPVPVPVPVPVPEPGPGPIRSEKRDVGKELFSLYERECCRVRFISIIISSYLEHTSPRAQNKHPSSV